MTHNPGIGPICKAGARATAEYSGFLHNGTNFDHSHADAGHPIKFTVGSGEMIDCLDEAAQKMRIGQQATLECPPDMAYGEEGWEGKVPPNVPVRYGFRLIRCDSMEILDL